MGLYDTIVFPRPIACAGCGAPQASTQSKQLGRMLETYRVGDVVAECVVATGVPENEAHAEQALLQVDRADILNYLIVHQKEERRLGAILRSALAVLSDYADYLKAPNKTEFLDRPLGAIVQANLKEHLQAEDPLASIVAYFRAEMGGADEDHGLF